MKPTLAYIRFEVLRALRNRRYLMFTIVLPAVFYLAFAGSGNSVNTIDGIPFTTYFLVSMVAYSAISSAFNAGGARLSAERSSGWLTQLRVTPLSTAGFVTGKVVTAVVMCFPGTILVGIAGHQVHNVDLSAVTWVQLYLTVWVGVLPFAALAMVLGYALDGDAAQAGTVAVLFVLSILGGLWAPINAFPAALQDIGKALPTYEIANAARAALNSSAPHLLDVTGLVTWTVVFGAALAWFYRRDDAKSAA